MTSPTPISQSEDESRAEVTRLMKFYEIDEDTAVRMRDVMALKGFDEDLALEHIREQNN
jgi:hypothetical protein